MKNIFTALTKKVITSYFTYEWVNVNDCNEYMNHLFHTQKIVYTL